MKPLISRSISFQNRRSEVFLLLVFDRPALADLLVDLDEPFT
jgi:hypothetical protein